MTDNAVKACDRRSNRSGEIRPKPSECNEEQSQSQWGVECKVVDVGQDVCVKLGDSWSKRPSSYSASSFCVKRHDDDGSRSSSTA